MLNEQELIDRYADTGDDALANHIRDAVKALNEYVREARRRGISVAISTLRGDEGHGYKVEKITAERVL